jgi:5-methylcytosine-specific restriction endonuclease McrA
MRSPAGEDDLAAVIEAAVTEKLERLEAKRFARTSTPRKTLDESSVAPNTRHIPAAVRRAVHERDGGRCRYGDPQGHRCPERNRLEFHHRHPFAHGGDHSPPNVALLCHVHNTLMAEHDFGARTISRRPGRGDSPDACPRGPWSNGHHE